jgi:anaerobic magnesium-protoporphyrin IX monomethyl ester cyclase
MENPMINKVLFVTSSFERPTITSKQSINEWRQDFGHDVAEREHYAMGLAYLHSYLESKGLSVEGLYLNNYIFRECFEKVKKKLEEFTPDVVGIQMLTPNRVSSYRIIEYIHDKYPNIKIVLGGLHATLMYNQLLEKYPFVTIVLGEGELTMEELIKKFNEKKPDFKKVKGIAYRDKEKIIINEQRPLMENLDVLPYPKHELFFKGNRTQACLLTSRGCPFKCSFCCINPLTKRRVRFRSVNNVVDEIEYLVKSFPKMKQIWIHDDTFTLDNQRAINICDEIIKRGIKTEFIASGRIKPISKELVKKLEEANFTTILLGIESGSDSILTRAHKAITKKDIMETFKLFQDSKINLKTFLILGLPGDTKETVLETSRFIRELQKVKYISFGVYANYLKVYPGSEVYEIAKEAGVISDKYWLSDLPSPFYTLEHSFEELNEFGEILLNYTSWRRMYKLQAFKHQWMMIPTLIKYLFTTKRELLLKKIIPFRK